MEFKPINAPTSTELFVDQVKQAILTGKLQPGDCLPSERQLGIELKVSRSVINRGLRQLQALHFIQMQPRQGNFVSNYWQEGTLATLDEIVRFHGGHYKPDLLQSIVATRRAMETDVVRLATNAQDDQELREMQRAVERGRNSENAIIYAEHTVAFFHHLYLAAHNQVYPLLFNSFRPTYQTLIRWNSEGQGATEILHYNQVLLRLIQSGDTEAAVAQDNALITWSLNDLLR